MNSTLKNILKGIAVVLILVGGIWFLQGINILPGSFMTGNPQWSINGGIAIIIGALIIASAVSSKK